MDFYIKMDEELIENGKLEPLEVLLYSRCYRFAENCKAMGREYYLDQTEAARFLRVSRKTLRGYVKRLEEIGLFVRIGYTATKQVIYCVKDWESMKHDVLLPTSELEALNGKYQAERERNRAQLQSHYDKKAEEAAEEVSTSFKQNTTPEPQEAVQKPVEPQPIQLQPLPEITPSRAAESVSEGLEEREFNSTSSIIAFVAGFSRDIPEAKKLAGYAKQYGSVEYKNYLIIYKGAA